MLEKEIKKKSNYKKPSTKVMEIPANSKELLQASNNEEQISLNPIVPFNITSSSINIPICDSTNESISPSIIEPKVNKNLKRSRSSSQFELQIQSKRQKISQSPRLSSSQEYKPPSPLFHLLHQQFSQSTNHLSSMSSSPLDLNITNQEEEEEGEEMSSLSQKYQTSAKYLDEKKEINSQELEIFKDQILGRGSFSIVISFHLNCFI